MKLRGQNSNGRTFVCDPNFPTRGRMLKGGKSKNKKLYYLVTMDTILFFII